MKNITGRVLAVLLACWLAACGTLEMGLETEANTPQADGMEATQTLETSLLDSTPTSNIQSTGRETSGEAYPPPVRSRTPAPTPTTSADVWREYRDRKSGVGFALPCWWTIVGGYDSEAISYAVTVSSFDEAYAWANSLGEDANTWPDGALKIDFYFVPVENTSLSDDQAVVTALTSELNAVDSIQPIAIGPYNGWLAMQSRREIPNSAGPVLGLRLAPDRLLLMGVLPNTQVKDATIQAILNSLALSADQPVALPATGPAGALVPTPFACVAPPNYNFPASTVATPGATALWHEFRDATSGVGFALPCWWDVSGRVNDAPADVYAVTVRSFDDAYARANSEKGVWIGGEWPSGAVKIDFYFVSLEAPSMSDEQAISATLTNSVSKVDSIEPKSIGPYTGWLAMQSSREIPDSAAPVLALRLAPERLLTIGVYPKSALTDATIQAIFGSLALSADRPVKLPVTDPAPALIPTPFACVVQTAP